jgi:tetratricopeptide (TPR) repeat protein
LYAATNKSDEAVMLYESAIANSDNKLPLQLEKVKLVSSLKGNGSGLNLLLDLAKENPKEALVYKSLSEHFADAGDQEKALQSARHALKINNNSLSKQDLLDLKYQFGKLSVDQGQLDQAIKLLEEVILKSPGNVNAYLDISKAYNLRRDHHKALAFVQQAIEIAPLNPLAYKEAGLLYKESKDYVSAESMLRKAAELNPRDLEGQRLLAAVVALNLIHNPK